MDNAMHRIRATGHYAFHDGQEYFAYVIGDRVRLHSDRQPLPEGFRPSSVDWIEGEKVVQLSNIQRLRHVETTCQWRGHPFNVGIIEGESANVVYLGTDFDHASDLPGMRRPDRFEVRGRAPVSELAHIEERVAEVPLTDQDGEKDSQQ